MIAQSILIAWPLEASRILYGAINGLAGRSEAFDSFVGLAVENNLVKAGLLGACFLFAWNQGQDAAATARRRKVLLVSLAAALLALATTKSISRDIFLPRPFLQSQTISYIEGDRLADAPVLAHRPLIGREGDAAARQKGDIDPEDFESFPSDHASFYMALAVGVWMASRAAGAIALLWTLFVILGSRIVTGYHSPLDIAVGAAIGIAWMAGLRALVERWGKRLVEPVVGWTFRYPGIAGAAAFLVLFEATDTLQNFRQILGVVQGLAA